MSPNTGIPVTDSARPLAQRNQLLCDWLTECLSVSVIKQQIWRSHWLESLRAGLREASSKTIKQGYRQLTAQLNNLLQQQYATDENAQNNWVSALLLQLLVMYVYRKNATACYHDQLMECPAMPWTEYVTQVMAMVPTAAYLHQLRQLVYKAIYKRPIASTVDRALLRIQKHALNFYFKQLLDELCHTTQDCLFLDKEDSAYSRYTNMIGVLHVYIGEIDNSSLKEKETAHLSKLLLEQLTQLIEITSTLDLSPSWIERLKQWIQECISQLTSLYTTTPSAAKTSYLRLFAISERLRKSTKKAVRNKKLPSLELIREGCWLYFSLHEQLITQWVDKKKYASEYQSTALALFESFMSTFDWSLSSKKWILQENPLKSSRFKFNRKKAIPVEHWESLLDPTLNKLSEDFFARNWFYLYSVPHPEKRSFLHWLVSRHEPGLMAKIKDYISKEEIEFQQDEILPLDKRNLYRLVKSVHEDFCKELNLLTQMILSVWFRDAGIIVSHADLARMLSKPGRWLYLNPEVPPTLEYPIPRFAFFMLQAVEYLGVGVYFFPPLQQRWSAFQEALAAHSGKATEFIREHDAEIVAILKKLSLMFHPDHEPKAEKNGLVLKGWAQRCLPKIQYTRDDLRKFRELTADEQQSVDTETERKAEFLLKDLKDTVLDCMNCHVGHERETVRLFSLSDDELRRCYDQKTYEAITKRKQIEVDTISERTRIKEALKEKDAEIERLKALLAEQEGQTLPQPSIAGSRLTLFPTPTTSQAPTDVTNHVVAKCS